MKRNSRLGLAVVATIAIVGASPSWAQSDADRIAELEAKTAAMAEMLESLQDELAQAKESGSVSDTQELRSEVIKATQYAQRAKKAANEWKDTIAVTHLAGYAAAGYSDVENGTDSFDVANFNPIFHFQYGDRILWESELEVEVEEDGSTEVGLEYSTIDVFLNDYLIFVAGKFISPLGQFRQNLHPAWINKFASAPPGFGHDGAAPLADIGFQLRGGVPYGQQGKFTYAGFVANGPKLEGEDGELHGIDTDGFTADADDEKIIGGRFSILPLPKLEIGVSAAFGDAAIVENDEEEIEGDPSRDYEVYGVDIAYQWASLDLRGEYIAQDVGDAAGSVAPEGGKWETWYAQGAYKFGEQAKWEGVVRYTDFDSPHSDEMQEQWAVGINYLLTPNAIFKVGYEFNDGLNGEETDSDRFLIQIAYGY